VKIISGLVFALLLSTYVSAQPVFPVGLEHRVAQVEGSENPENSLGLAQGFLQRGRFDEAEKLALHVLQEAPQSYGARFILAKVALSTGRVGLAQKYISELLQMNPQDPDSLVLQAMVLMFQDKPGQSVDYLKQALELGQEQQTAGQLASYVNTLVLAYHQNKQPELALETCLEGIQNYPSEPDLYLSCSRLYREAGDYGQALEVAQKGLSGQPDFHALYASIALAQAGLGNPELANQAYLELKARDPKLASELKATLDGAREDSAELKVRVD
jgi:tetratricopeptide (TPR) repeat protein